MTSRLFNVAAIIIFLLPVAISSMEIVPDRGVQDLRLGPLSGPGALAVQRSPFLRVGMDSLACLSFSSAELKKSGSALESFLIEIDERRLHDLRDDQLDIHVAAAMKRYMNDRWIVEAIKQRKIYADSEKGGLYKEIELPKALPTFLKGKAGLKVSGRQKIALGGESAYQVGQPTDPNRSNSKFPQLQMEQELRVSLKGNVGDKISVVVDHDSSQRLNSKNKIRIRYEGTEDEIIQEIEAGNTSLSLGSGPEFITPSFSHQGLFGIRGRGQMGPATLKVIASKEESQKQTTSFTGQAKLDTIEIRDTQYIHNRYYAVTMEPGSPTYYDTQDSVISIQVYVDDQYQDPNDLLGGHHGICYLDPNEPGEEERYEGVFELLAEGKENDYNFSRSSGILELNNPLQENYVLAVLFESVNLGQVGGVASDTTKVLKLIKPANLTNGSQTWAYELRNVYYLGSREIDSVRFRLKIKRKVPSGFDIEEFGGKSYLHLLGLDNDNNGLVDIDRSAIDFATGVLFFPYAEPFNQDSLLDTLNPTLYSKRYDKLKADDNLYYLEASYELLQSTYSLSPFMEENSVQVRVNGVKMEEGRDFDIEFFELRFRPGVIGGPDDQINISYEVKPLFAASQKTLLGARLELPMSRNTLFGATWMYQGEGGPKSTLFPRFGEEPRRSMVADVDGRMEFQPRWLTDAVNWLPTVRTDAKSTITLSGEFAYSMPNPNTRGSAYVDDMEGTQISTSVSTGYQRWTHSSLPPETEAGQQDSTFYWHNFGLLDPNRMTKNDIYPDSLIPDSRERADHVEVLNLRMQPGDQMEEDTWAGLQILVQSGGADFSEREFLEVLVRGETGILHLDFGSISEDQVRGGVDPNAALDKEDQNPEDGVWTSRDEDTGFDGKHNADEPGTGDDPSGDDYDYSDTDPQDYTRVNKHEGNNREDTEDLNGNGQLDRQEEFFSFALPLVGENEFVEAEYLNGWRLFRLPLTGNHVSRYGNADWTNIQYCRLWVSDYTDEETVLIQTAGIDIVGSTWLSEGISSDNGDIGPDEQFRIKVRNNKEDAEYEPPYDPGDDERTGFERREQSLVFRVENLSAGHQASAYQAFYREQDYSGYEGFAFWIRNHDVIDEAGLPVEPVVWVRLGANENNYYEIRLRPPGETWEKVEVDIGQLTRTKIEGNLVTEEGYLLRVAGSPSITRVARLTAGIENTSGRGITGEVWLNDLHLIQVKRERGSARRVSMKVQIADLASLDADYRKLDATYRRLDQRGSSGATSSTTSGRLSTRVSLDQFAPDHWGMSLPLSWSWTWQNSRPRLLPGSDTPLTAEEQYREESINDSRRISANLSKTKPSRNIFIRSTLDRIKLSFSQTGSRKTGPSRSDTTLTHNMSVNWDWSSGRKSFVRIPLMGEFHYLPTNLSLGLSGEQRDQKLWLRSEDVYSRSPTRYSRTVREKAGFGIQPFKALTGSYSFDASRDLTYDKAGEDLLDSEFLRPTADMIPFWKAFSAREVGRNQSINLQLKPRMAAWFDPSFIYDTAYNENHSPGLSQIPEEGEERVDVRDAGNTTSREVRITVSMNQLFNKIARTGDGNVGVLKAIGSLGGKFQAIQGNIKRRILSKYRDLGGRPNIAYQLGIDREVQGITPHDVSVSDSWGLSGGMQLSKDVRLSARGSGSEDSRMFSGSETGNNSTTFPDVDLSWTGLHKIGFLKERMSITSSTLRSSYKRTNSSRGRFEGDEYIKSGSSQKENFSPRLSLTLRWQNGFTVTLGDNYSREVSEDFLQAQVTATTHTSHRTNLSTQYAFSAPQGMNLPIFGRMRFKSDLRLSLDMSIDGNQTLAGSRPTRDDSSWSVRPGASYDFGVVDSGLQLWVTQSNNKIQDRKLRTIGLRIWIEFPF